jgi:hypothetical protein
MTIADDLTRLKDGYFPVARDGAWTTDPDAAWAVADLQKSGITSAAAEAARLAVTKSRPRIGDLLNRRTNLPGGPCLVFPYFDPAGDPIAYARIKPKQPRVKLQDGEPDLVRYDAPSGCPARLYIPPAVVPYLADLAITLILAEGEKKGIALNQHGFPAVAVAGVWNLLKKCEGVERGRSFADYEFRWPDEVPLKARRVILLFDSDARSKSNMPLALKYVGQHLAARGADVRVAALPDADNGDKVGADDFLVAHGPEALRAILDAAQVPTDRTRPKKAHGDDADGEAGKGPPAAEILTAIGSAYDLWHDSEDKGFVANGRRSVAVKSRAFRMRLVADYRRQTGKVPNAEALNAALLAIEATAVLDGPLCEANVRIAEYGGRVYVHLADDADTVFEIDADGWRERPDPPVRFVRAKGMLALPTPRPGGKLEDLRRVLNCPDDCTFALIRAWFAQAFRKPGPFPLLVLLGEQGTAKTTTSRVLKRLTDPREADVRSEPNEARDLMIGANHNWVLAFDNLSGLPGWLSDALCRLSTGGSFSIRGLYTDDEEITFSAKRPMILNGIEDFVTRPDLLERALIVHHPPIPEEQRRPEADVWAEFDELAPGLLGAMFDYVAGGLRELPRLEKVPLPRMADFAKFAMACETARAGTCDGFLAAYRDNQAGANEQVLDSSPVAAALQKFMAARDEWAGTGTELLNLLNPLTPDPKDRDWPKKPNALSGKLKRLAPSLRRAAGLDVRTGGREGDRKRTRQITIRKLSDVTRTGSYELSTPSDGPAPRPETAAPALDDPRPADDPVIVHRSSDDMLRNPPEYAPEDEADEADDLPRNSDRRPPDPAVEGSGKRKRGRI